jgi:protein-disulfide isomerase
MKTSTMVWVVIGALVLGFGLILLTRPAPQAVQTTVPPIAADDYVKGATSSPVVLVEYLDFECEACGAYYPVVKQLEAEYGDRVAFVARYFPLPNHRNGIPAALAAEAAGRQGKFWEMHDLLFTRQTTWGEKQMPTPEVFEAYAQELGLDMERFKSDVASDEVRTRVLRDVEIGQNIGVKSTPTFFLNGKPVRAQNYEAFKAILDNELKMTTR